MSSEKLLDYTPICVKFSGLGSKKSTIVRDISTMSSKMIKFSVQNDSTLWQEGGGEEQREKERKDNA
jgi:hypothetical protein